MFTSLAIGLFTSQQKVAFVESFSHWSSGSLGVKTNWFTTTPHTWLSRILTLFKYFAQGFKLSPSIPLTRTFTWRTTSVLFFRDLVYIFASIRKNWNSAHVPLICSLFGSTHLSGTSVLSKGYKFLNTLKANLNKFETPVTIQLIRYFQISWPDVALLILKTVNVCIVTFLFFWRDRHRNLQTKTKKTNPSLQGHKDKSWSE